MSQVKSSDKNRLEFILVILAQTGQYNTTQNKGDNKSDWTYTKDITSKLDTCVVTSVNIQDKVLVHLNTLRRRTKLCKQSRYRVLVGIKGPHSLRIDAI